MFKLLLIEDDESLFQEIKERLTGWSYEVYGIDDFSEVMQEFAAIKPDCVIIDIQLPKYDGFHWCRQIRSRSNVPILFYLRATIRLIWSCPCSLEQMIIFRNRFILTC